MKRLRVHQVITRWVLGGARRVVETLLRRLPPEEFEQTLVCGEMDGEAEGVETLRVPSLVRDIRPLRDAGALARLAWIFSRRRPDVVHAHTYKAGMLAAVAARAAGVRAVVVTPHGHIFARNASIPGVPPPGLKLGLLRRITRAAQNLADRVTALSEEDRDQQIALELAAPERFVVVRNGIDVDRFAAPTPRRAGGPVVGAVGRFTAEKGHAVLLDAFARLKAGRPGVRLELVGYGELEAELRARAAPLGDACRFTGARDAAEVLGGFDVFVQPSHYESQGIAILEAMAAGRPVVATDVGGVRDAVEPGVTGLLVPPGDPAALARAVGELLDDPGRASAMGERGRRRVRERFSAGRMSSDYARLYRELTGGYNPPACTTT